MTARLGLMLGLLVAAAIGTWWLAATRVALVGGGATATLAGQALFALSVARPMLVGIVGLRTAALGGFGAGSRTAVPVVLAAWPLVALAWLASAASLAHTLTIEVALLGYALLVAALGHGLRRALRSGRWPAAVTTLLGITLAAGAWLLSGLWQTTIGG